MYVPVFIFKKVIHVTVALVVLIIPQQYTYLIYTTASNHSLRRTGGAYRD